MLQKISLILILAIFSTSLWAKRVFDTTQIKKAITIPVKKYIVCEQRGAYVIAGKQSERLFLVNMRYKAKDLAKKKRIPSNVQFNDLLQIENNILLISTPQNGIYYVRNGVVLHIGEQFGLTDTAVLGLLWDGKHHRVFIRTQSAYFVSADYGYRRYVRMTETDKNSMLDSGAQSVSEFFERYVQQPIQAGISNVAADIDYSFRPVKAIKRKQFRVIRKNLQPGDVLIKRNESQLTNVGIPGFWTHAAFYVGNKRDINRNFTGLARLHGQKPSTWLKKNYPKVWKRIKQERNAIIEAIGEGVCINPLEHIALVDNFAALRLNRSADDVFSVLIQSFEYYGSPYDYLFDFNTEKALVCSELVYKSITKTTLQNPISISQSEVLGKPFVTPSDFASQFCNQSSNTDAALTLILFYKANSHFSKAELKNEADFCSLKLK